MVQFIQPRSAGLNLLLEAAHPGSDLLRATDELTLGFPRVFPSLVAVPHRPFLTSIITSSNSLSIVSCLTALHPAAARSAFMMASWVTSGSNVA